MSDHIKKRKIDGDWPKLPAEEDVFKTSATPFKIYYYLDPHTGQMDADRTLRAMIWLFNRIPKDHAETLSAYPSIMNVFTYPEFERIAPMLPSLVGLRFQPTAFTEMTFPEVIPNFNVPLSSDDRLVAIAMFTFMFEFPDIKGYRQHRPQLIVSAAGDVCRTAGVFNPNLVAYEKSINGSNCNDVITFLMCTVNIPLCKYMYDCLVRKAVATGNKKAEQLLRLCGEKMPKMMACKTILFNR